MNKTLHVVLFTLTIATIAGCASKPTVAPSASTATRNAPNWIDHPELPDALTGIGIAQSNILGDKSMQRATATANARVDLAQKLKVRVQGLFSQLAQQVTNAGNDGKATVRSDVATRMTENASRILTDQQLSGSMVRETWTDPSDGNLYALVVLSKDSVDNALSEIARSQIQQQINQGEHNLDRAMQKLDAAITATR